MSRDGTVPRSARTSAGPDENRRAVLASGLGPLERSSGERSDFDDRAKPAGGDGGVRSSDAAWLMLLPLVCCGGPVLIVAAASAGAIGWGALGAGIAAVIAAVLLIARRRAARSCTPGSRTRTRLRAGGDAP